VKKSRKVFFKKALRFIYVSKSRGITVDKNRDYPIAKEMSKVFLHEKSEDYLGLHLSSEQHR